MFFGFQLTCGLMMVFYGYSVMKNPRVWGDQGRQAVKAENFPEYCRQNGLFFLKAGLIMALIGALDALVLLLALAPCGKREEADQKAAQGAGTGAAGRL